MTRKRVKGHLLQIISVTTQVAISRRVSSFKLQLRDRQEARRSRGRGDDRPTLDVAVGFFFRSDQEGSKLKIMLHMVG